MRNARMNEVTQHSATRRRHRRGFAPPEMTLRAIEVAQRTLARSSIPSRISAMFFIAREAEERSSCGRFPALRNLLVRSRSNMAERFELHATRPRCVVLIAGYSAARPGARTRIAREKIFREKFFGGALFRALLVTW
jgi:hypothetical protein